VLPDILKITELDIDRNRPGQNPSQAASSSASAELIPSPASAPLTDLSNLRDKLMEQTQHDVEEILDRLFRLTALIRKSGLSSRHAKAIGYEEVNEQGVNLTSKFKILANRIMDFKFPDATETLRANLAETINVRRRQFLYSKHHQENLSKKSAAPEVKISPFAVSPDLSQATTKRDKNDNISETLPKRPRGSAPTHSSASAIGSQLAVNNIQQRVSPSSWGSRSRVQATSVNLPIPPKLKPGAKEFQCPWCFIVQPKEVLEKTKWESVVWFPVVII
jgi:hypothetical protein